MNVTTTNYPNRVGFSPWIRSALASLLQSKYARSKPVIHDYVTELLELTTITPPWTSKNAVQLFFFASNLMEVLTAERAPKHWTLLSQKILDRCQYSGYLPLELQKRLRAH